jgi:hypothetical protein
MHVMDSQFCKACNLLRLEEQPTPVTLDVSISYEEKKGREKVTEEKELSKIGDVSSFIETIYFRSRNNDLQQLQH